MPAVRSRRIRGVALLVLAAALLVVLFTVPSYSNSYRLYLFTQVLIFATAAMGLTVLLGWSGQIAMAHAGFFGVGAYVSTWLYGLGMPWVVAMLAAGLIATLFGLVIGLPAVRLRGFYLAIATLAFGELLVRLFVIVSPVTGGSSGLSVPGIVLGALDHSASVWYATLIVFLLTLAGLAWLSRSRIGRSLRAVRDIEIATGSLGLSAVRFKLLAFAISAFLGAVGGALFAQLVTFLTPDIFGTTLLIQFLVVVFVGGVTRLDGAVVGAIFLIFSRELLQDVGSWQRFAFGAALLIVVRFLPRGLMSLPERIRRRNRPDAPAGLPAPTAPQTADAGAAS